MSTCGQKSCTYLFTVVWRGGSSNDRVNAPCLILLYRLVVSYATRVVTRNNLCVTIVVFTRVRIISVPSVPIRVTTCGSPRVNIVYNCQSPNTTTRLRPSAGYVPFLFVRHLSLTLRPKRTIYSHCRRRPKNPS